MKRRTVSQVTINKTAKRCVRAEFGARADDVAEAKATIQEADFAITRTVQLSVITEDHAR